MPGWRRGQKPGPGQSGALKAALAIHQKTFSSALAQVAWKILRLSEHLHSHHFAFLFAVLTVFLSEDCAFAIFACVLLLPGSLLAD